ncbi:C-type lectin BML-2-like isoform X2 [Acanthopagrus latus]|uniref:C-type lectin BML-2-like isoform X2 n=1 Tax=Acanthopagrus latus TaxID=8177 RepID=UPI00187C75C5|nr:C-type lectin BML-2-like isoform X2 [Acanthopagrus latus]
MEICWNSHANHLSQFLCIYISGCQSSGSPNCDVKFSDRLPSTKADWEQLCTGKPGIMNECPQCNGVKIQLKRHPVSGDCLSNSDSGNGLQFYKAPKSWIDALEHCHNQDSSLAEIHNQTVQASVNSSLLNKDSMLNGMWIGLERSIFGRNSTWKWISGTPVGNHCPWNKSYPVDALNHHCGKIIWVAELGQFKWLDACCHEELPFICQTPT